MNKLGMRQIRDECISVDFEVVGKAVQKLSPAKSIWKGNMHNQVEFPHQTGNLTVERLFVVLRITGATFHSCE